MIKPENQDGRKPWEGDCEIILGRRVIAQAVPQIAASNRIKPDPSMHRATKVRSSRVRMEARSPVVLIQALSASAAACRPILQFGRRMNRVKASCRTAALTRFILRPGAGSHGPAHRSGLCLADRSPPTHVSERATAHSLTPNHLDFLWPSHGRMNGLAAVARRRRAGE
jgi:hypothetical protein